jgi:hypothetical protein
MKEESMPKHEFGQYRISSDRKVTSTTVKKRTLIVSTHGGRTNETFQPKAWTHCRFMAPKNGALVADLYDAINDDLVGADFPGTSGAWDDYKLVYYEGDDKSREIAKYLEKNKVTTADVLTLRRSGLFHKAGTSTLKDLLAWLEAKDLKYPRIDCLFCRVDLDDNTKNFDFSARKSPTLKVADNHRFNAQLINNEMKARGNAL